MESTVVIKDAHTKTFGAVIKDARTQLGRTQAALATDVHISVPEVCKIERGNRHPNIKTAAALLRVLGLDNGWLMRAVLEQSAAHSGLCLEEFDAVLCGRPA